MTHHQVVANTSAIPYLDSKIKIHTFALHTIRCSEENAAHTLGSANPGRHDVDRIRRRSKQSQARPRAGQAPLCCLVANLDPRNLNGKARHRLHPSLANTVLPNHFLLVHTCRSLHLASAATATVSSRRRWIMRLSPAFDILRALSLSTTKDLVPSFDLTQVEKVFTFLSQP